MVRLYTILVSVVLLCPGYPKGTVSKTKLWGESSYVIGRIDLLEWIKPAPKNYSPVLTIVYIQATKMRVI